MDTDPPTPASRANYARIAKETESNLRKHVLDQWFPRSLDSSRGGFDENFGEDWTPGDPNSRSLVYQARLTWVAAKASGRYGAGRPGNYEQISNHGVSFLNDQMWDKVRGGLFWSGEDTSKRDAEKHAYGMAFAIYACAANYHACHNLAALDLAKKTFTWLEIHGHDGVNGGYYEALDQSGRPILGVADQGSPGWPRRSGNDSIGTAYGRKSMNTHIHLLEALSELHEVWPDPLVVKRLSEVFAIVRDKVVDPRGYQDMFFTPAWQPVTDEDSYGHDIETAFLLTEAAAVLGKPSDAKTWKAARSLVDHTLAVGWDKTNGGVYDHGTRTTGATDARGESKIWWVQAEALNSFLLMHERYGKLTTKYWDAFVREWQFISRYQVDHVHLGWYRDVSREGHPRSGATKSDGWTEAYHQGRALMNVTDRLRRLSR